MRERLDCAMFATTCTAGWADRWLGSHAGGRLLVQSLSASADIALPETCHELAASNMRLRRFDVCLLPVSEGNLAWVRTTMSAAQGVLRTPVVALVQQLKAAALNDLYELGLADFVRGSLCPDELRARVERILDAGRYGARDRVQGVPMPVSLNERPISYAGPNVVVDMAESALHATILERSGLELDAFAAASASRCATSKESFRTAKSRVVERFERAYITAALGRHSGNIAMAARAAQKHRRAFWALMRKHQIDAAPYRSESPPKPPSGG
jgi:DNA-binding NtrC family response regulator